MKKRTAGSERREAFCKQDATDFFFNDTATTEIYTLSLHDALPILDKREEYSRKYDIQVKDGASVFKQTDREQSLIHLRSEEHTSELQSH